MRAPVPALWMLAYCTALSSCREGPIYHNQFAVRVPAGRRQADVIAARHGFTNLGQIGKLPGYYLFEHQHVHKRSLTPSELHRHKLASEPEVHWVQQQHEKVRKKRDFVDVAPDEMTPDVFCPGQQVYSGYPPKSRGREPGSTQTRPCADSVLGTCGEKQALSDQTRRCTAREHFNTSIAGDSHVNWCKDLPRRR